VHASSSASRFINFPSVGSTNPSSAAHCALNAAIVCGQIMNAQPQSVTVSHFLILHLGGLQLLRIGRAWALEARPCCGHTSSHRVLCSRAPAPLPTSANVMPPGVLPAVGPAASQNTLGTLAVT
jgi:hypothetical protein